MNRKYSSPCRPGEGACWERRAKYLERRGLGRQDPDRWSDERLLDEQLLSSFVEEYTYPTNQAEVQETYKPELSALRENPTGRKQGGILSRARRHKSVEWYDKKNMSNSYGCNEEPEYLYYSEYETEPSYCTSGECMVYQTDRKHQVRCGRLEAQCLIIEPESEPEEIKTVVKVRRKSKAKRRSRERRPKSAERFRGKGLRSAERHREIPRYYYPLSVSKSPHPSRKRHEGKQSWNERTMKQKFRISSSHKRQKIPTDYVKYIDVKPKKKRVKRRPHKQKSYKIKKRVAFQEPFYEYKQSCATPSLITLYPQNKVRTAKGFVNNTNIFPESELPCKCKKCIQKYKLLIADRERVHVEKEKTAHQQGFFKSLFCRKRENRCHSMHSINQQQYCFDEREQPFHCCRYERLPMVVSPYNRHGLLGSPCREMVCPHEKFIYRPCRKNKASGIRTVVCSETEEEIFTSECWYTDCCESQSEGGRFKSVAFKFDCYKGQKINSGVAQYFRSIFNKRMC